MHSKASKPSKAPRARVPTRAHRKPVNTSRRQPIHTKTNPRVSTARSASLTSFNAPSPIQTSFSPQRLFNTMSFQPSTLKSSFIQPSKFQLQQQNPLTMAKRGLILKPKQPLDNNVELRLEFNVIKAAEPIVELPDDQYPAWIWNLGNPDKSLYEIGKLQEDDMDLATVRRKFKLERRESIKSSNTLRRK